MSKCEFIARIRAKRSDIVDVISEEHKYGSEVLLRFAVRPDFVFYSATLNPYSVGNLKKIGIA